MAEQIDRAAEPVATMWREKNVSLYPGIMFDLTEEGKALPLGERHQLYTATALAAAQVQENERIAKFFEGTAAVLYFGSKAADEIRALIGEPHVRTT